MVPFGVSHCSLPAPLCMFMFCTFKFFVPTHRQLRASSCISCTPCHVFAHRNITKVCITNSPKFQRRFNILYYKEPSKKKTQLCLVIRFLGQITNISLHLNGMGASEGEVHLQVVNLSQLDCSDSCTSAEQWFSCICCVYCRRFRIILA